MWTARADFLIIMAMIYAGWAVVAYFRKSRQPVHVQFRHRQFRVWDVCGYNKAICLLELIFALNYAIFGIIALVLGVEIHFLIVLASIVIVVGPLQSIFSKSIEKKYRTEEEK